MCGGRRIATGFMSTKRKRWSIQYGFLIILGNVFAFLAEWIVSREDEALVVRLIGGWLGCAVTTLVVVLAAIINWYRKEKVSGLTPF